MNPPYFIVGVILSGQSESKDLFTYLLLRGQRSYADSSMLCERNVRLPLPISMQELKGEDSMQTYQIRLRQLREDHDKTQREIAEYLGINQTVYSRYETGRNDMKPAQIIALCEYYKVSADYVLGLPEGRPYGLSKTK